MVKKIILIFAFIGFATINAQELKKCPSIPANQRDLFIINDPEFKETKSDNITLTVYLLAHFFAGSAPILAQVSVWQRFLQELNFGEFASLQKQAHQLKCDFYDIKDSFVLIIPHAYKERFNLTENNIGFNFNNPAIKAIHNPFEYVSSYRLGYAFSTAKGKIFGEKVNQIELLEVLKSIIQKKYSWNFLMTGHGSNSCSQNVIAALPRQQFRETLEFFNSIKVNVFTYNSCYAASKASLIDTYTTNKKPNIYNFPIAIAALGTAPAYNDLFSSIFPYVKSSTPVTEAAFNTLLKKLANFFVKLRTLSFCLREKQKIVEALDDLYNFRESLLDASQAELNNLIQVRWAHSPLFVPLPLEGFVSVSSEFGRGLKKFFAPPVSIKDVAIIINNPYLDQALLLPKSHNKIASSLPGQEFHYIKSIKAPENTTVESLFPMFKAIAESKEPKHFLIDSYIYGNEKAPKVVDNIIVKLNEKSLVSDKKVDEEIFFMKDDEGFILTEKQTPEHATELKKIKLGPDQTDFIMSTFELEKDELKEKYASKFSFAGFQKEDIKTKKPSPKMARSKTPGLLD